MLVRLILFVAMMLGSSSIAETQGPHRALSDPASAKAWRAVGRLDIDNRGFCTASLIADHLVLTAAHCLFAKTNGAQLSADKMIFKAGFQRGRSAATRRGARYVIHPNYRHNSPDKVKNVPFDIAVIELESPIRTADIIPFDLHRKPRLDDSVMVVSYARGRSEIPSIEDGCKMFDVYREALIYSCDVDFGASGSPVFVMTTAGPKIASVMTSKSQFRDKKVSLGAPLGTSLQRLLNELATTNPTSKFVGSKPLSIGEQLGRREARTGLPQITR